jgi:redox-sensitive bicupin YhaK (pirin superfamily)
MSLDLVIHGRPRDVGGFAVRRVLPAVERRMVGPFVFFDHLGPIDFEPGHGIDVRPHPHIALATVTYLFDGEIVHRDSLGSTQPIRPGDVNWMIAGRGIVHSERTGDEARRRGGKVHGIQCWVALPTAREEAEPSFGHHPSATIPSLNIGDASLRVVAGSAYGKTSPVNVESPTLYVEARLPAGCPLTLPDEHQGRAAYVVEGSIEHGVEPFEPGSMLIFKPGEPAAIRARTMARVMLLGGAPLDGDRHVYWNFVSSSKERIERAKRDWKEGRFPRVPGDDKEWIPLPET